MSKFGKKFSVISLISILILMLLPFSTYANDPLLTLSESSFNISSIEFEGKEPYSLRGVWEFYPSKRILPKDFNGRARHVSKQMVSVPLDLYNPETFTTTYGSDYGTLRTHVNLDSAYIGKAMALRSTLFYQNTTVYVDGIEYISPKDNSRFYSIHEALTPQVIANFVPQKERIEIVIHFSMKDNLSKNFGSIVIGQSDQVYSGFVKHLILDIIVFSSLLTLSIFNIAFYFSKHRRVNKEKIGIYFAMLIALMSLRILNLGEHYVLYLLPEIPGELFAKLGYWSYYLTVPMLVVFVSEVKSDIFPKYIQKSGLIATMIFGLFVLMVGYEIYSKLMWLYYVYSFIAFFYVGLFFVKATRRYKNTSVADLVSLSLALLTFLADSLYINGLSQFQYFYIFGAFAFIIYNTMLLSMAYGNAVDKLEDLYLENTELSEKVFNLEEGIERAIEAHTSALQQQIDSKTQRMLASERVIAQMEGALVIFDSQLRIESVHGKDAERLLGSELIGKKVIKVLFAQQLMDGQFFEEVLYKVLSMNKESRIETFMSLLPNTTQQGGKTLSIETNRITLQDRKEMHFSILIKEQSELILSKKQIDSLSTNILLLQSFIRFKGELLYMTKWLHHFFDQELKQLMESCKTSEALLERVLGILERQAIWHQAFGFVRTSDNLKQFSLELSRLYQTVENISMQDLIAILEDAQLKKMADEDFRSLKDYVGTKELSLNISHNELEQTKKSLVDCLEVFEPYSKVVADNFGKLIKPVIVQGDTIDVSLWKTGNFIRSLARVFDTLIYHSIEYYDERTKSGKPVNGSIVVNTKIEESLLIISIEDDGQGFQINVLKDNLFKMNLLSFKEMIETSESEILQYLFVQGFHYKESEKGWTAFGNELWRIKEAVTQKHGSIWIDPEHKTGARFVIELPIKELV